VRVSITAIGDTIAVIKNGEVAEKGRHEVFMKITDGVYASLVALHSSAS
jgi:ATP-binding cassette, subfamily B (MDR/TAP), member 1